MTCLNERIVGAIFFALSGTAIAGGTSTDAPVALTIANLAPQRMEMPLPPIPEPQQVALRPEPTPMASQVWPFTMRDDGVYGSPLLPAVHVDAGKPEPAPGGPLTPAASYLRIGPSTAPQVSIIQLPDLSSSLNARPQRGLTVTTNDWAFSATARVAVFGSHETGASLTARHRF